MLLFTEKGKLSSPAGIGQDQGDITGLLWSELLSDRVPFLSGTFHLPLSSEGRRTGGISFQKEQKSFQVSTSLETLARL